MKTKVNAISRAEYVVPETVMMFLTSKGAILSGSAEIQELTEINEEW